LVKYSALKHNLLQSVLMPPPPAMYAFGYPPRLRRHWQQRSQICFT